MHVRKKCSAHKIFSSSRRLKCKVHFFRTIGGIVWNRTMDDVAQIKNKVEVLYRSSKSHALIVESAAGWGKTTAVDDALKLAGFTGKHLGSYSTPLNLFRFLQENNTSIVILDDVAGLFTDRP